MKYVRKLYRMFLASKHSNHLSFFQTKISKALYFRSLKNVLTLSIGFWIFLLFQEDIILKMQMPHFICTLQHNFYCNLFVCFHICVWKGNQMSGFALHTPVLTSDNIIRSLMANVSPCFIFILFLSKHFIAYLKTTWKQWFYFLSVCIITTHILTMWHL